MRPIWLAAVLMVAGAAIVLLRPMFLTDGGVGVYASDAGLLTWIGWILLIVGGLLTALALFRSRRKDRS